MLTLHVSKVWILQVQASLKYSLRVYSLYFIVSWLIYCVIMSRDRNLRQRRRTVHGQIIKIGASN